MMENKQQYFEFKMEMLTSLLASSEDIMSNINNDNWEDYEQLASERREIIEDINAFEAAYRPLFEKELSSDEVQAINNQVKLIMDFDSDIVARLEAEKRETIKEMNASKQERNIFDGYKKAEVPAFGTFLDTKK